MQIIVSRILFGLYSISISYYFRELTKILLLLNTQTHTHSKECLPFAFLEWEDVKTAPLKPNPLFSRKKGEGGEAISTKQC